MLEKSNIILRKLVLLGLIISFAILSSMFIYQYLEYKKLEQRLNKAYSSQSNQSPGLYKLFSTLSEADSHFRFYTLSFEKKDYIAYIAKLDTVKLIIDSLAALPITENPIKGNNQNNILESRLALQYASLKKQVDDILYYGHDSLQVRVPAAISQHPQRRAITSDSVIGKIVKDTHQLARKQDTVVRKKERLFNRIFKAKNDTIINQKTNEVLNVTQTDIVQRNIDKLISSNEQIYQSNLRNLRSVFQQLQTTEKNLILYNYSLLSNLKTGIEQLRQIEREEARKAEESDFSLYKENSANFGNQLIVSLFIMLLMILLLLYYQFKVTSYSKKLVEEKEYASKVAEQKSNVLASISHEVRSPLASLQGLVNLLKNDDYTKISSNRKIIQTIDNDINIINGTLNDILNLSKIEAGKLEITLSYISPYKIIEDLVALHHYQAETKKIELINNNHISPDLLIFGSSFRLNQIISNLLSNAIKYTPEGTVQIDSFIKKSKDKEKLIIKVTDTGIGIHASQKDKIFRKYFVADHKTKGSGFGLGLYIAKTLTEQANGTLNFSSEPGKGTIFKFQLEIQSRLMNKNLETPRTVADLPKDLKLVFVDDNRIGLYYIQELFKGYPNIRLFHDGQEALNYITNSPVDIVVTDLMMPNINGWDILAHIKSNELTSDIKVIVCTAENMLLENKLNTKQFKFDDVINKPLEENNLVSTILKVNSESYCKT